MKRDYDALVLRAEHWLISGDSPEVCYGEDLVYELKESVRDLWLKEQLLRPKRIRPVSRKHAKVLRDAKESRDAYREAHPYCEFEREEPGVMHACARPTDDIHEIVSRARGGSLTDTSNLKALCRFHHDWITTHPKEATEQGWLRSKVVAQ